MRPGLPLHDHLNGVIVDTVLSRQRRDAKSTLTWLVFAANRSHLVSRQLRSRSALASGKPLLGQRRESRRVRSVVLSPLLVAVRNVCRVRDTHEVTRVDAMPSVAFVGNVITAATGENPPECDIERYPVRPMPNTRDILDAFEVTLPVATGTEVPDPQPTRSQLRRVRGNWSVLIDPLPKLLDKFRGKLAVHVSPPVTACRAGGVRSAARFSHAHYTARSMP